MFAQMWKFHDIRMRTRYFIAHGSIEIAENFLIEFENLEKETRSTPPIYHQRQQQYHSERTMNHSFFSIFFSFTVALLVGQRELSVSYDAMHEFYCRCGMILR